MLRCVEFISIARASEDGCYGRPGRLGRWVGQKHKAQKLLHLSANRPGGAIANALNQRGESPRQCRVELIGRKGQGLRQFIRVSLVGVHFSPPGMPLSHMDNLIYLLGAYVEKKGAESETRYVKQS